MTVEEWRDVPPGVPTHHHCVVSVESHNEPKHWRDGTRTPDLVAWQPQDALTWIREQLVEHRDQAVEAYGRRDEIDAVLNSSDMWERLGGSLGRGRWAMLTFHLRLGSKLVLQILSYADAGQPAGDYAVCRQHQRPDDQTYHGGAS